MKALLKGTVFSGHPSRTTWGNTIRILYYNYALAAKYGYLEGYHCFVAGDDVLEIIESWLIDKHKLAMKESHATVDTKGNYGIGMVLKQCTYSQTEFTFLSKKGSINRSN